MIFLSFTLQISLVFKLETWESYQRKVSLVFLCRGQNYRYIKDSKHSSHDSSVPTECRKGPADLGGRLRGSDPVQRLTGASTGSRLATSKWIIPERAGNL